MKSKKGITLITLVVTIVILLILAGITITSMTGENGLFTRAKQAKQEALKASAEEDVRLRIMEATVISDGSATKESFLQALNNASDTYLIELASVATISEEGIHDAAGLTGDVNVTNITKYPGVKVKVLSNFTVESSVLTASAGSSGSGSGGIIPSGTINITENGVHDVTNYASANVNVSTEPTSTLSSVQVSNYGDYINLGTTILNTSTTPALSDGSSIQGDWRIFYKDDTHVYAILSSYLPNTNSAITNSGLSKVTTSGYDYSVNASSNRWDLIDVLVPVVNKTNSWNSLIGTSLKNKGAEVNGAVDLKMWVASWNQKYSTTTLYTPRDEHGYHIGNSSSTTSTVYDVSGDTGGGYSDTLYFPYREGKANCSGYWLASPSASGSTKVMSVTYGGIVRFHSYDDANRGVRPVVSLPSNIPATSNTDSVTGKTTWTVEGIE